MSNRIAWLLLLTPLAAASPARADSLALNSCPATSTPSNWGGTVLDTDTVKAGTVFDGAGSGKLSLQKTGALFTATQLSSPGTMMYAAVADFNKDGWPDFVAAPENTSNDYLSIFRNYTWENENCTTAACTAYSGAGKPNWDNPSVIITPKFTQGLNLHTKYTATTTAVTYKGRYALAAADFDGDGWPDVFEGLSPSTAYNTISNINVYLNAAANDAQGHATWQARYAANSGFTPANILGKLWSAGTTQAVDYNKDGRMDVIIANGMANGSVRILLNSCPGTMQPSGVIRCSSPPMFTDGGYLISNLGTVGSSNQGYGTNVDGGIPTIAYGDVDSDGLPDLIVGAPNCCSTATRRLRLFKGCAGGTGCTAGLENVASQSLKFDGAATTVYIADFSLDGKPDVMVATDDWNYNSGNGGNTFYYANNGTSTPFTANPVQLTYHSTVADFDIGFVFDYDRDPTNTPDLMIADGNNSLNYYVLANRVAPQYVNCGDAASGTINLGTLDDSEMVVTAARITPSFTLNGGSITFWMSNEDPANWVQASLCTGSSVDYCVSFPKPVGRSVRWKAVMCSNAAHTTTPELRTMTAKFDYTRAREHYRAGVVVNDGLAYVGAFHQPGERGKFYGMSADLATSCSGQSSPICWEAGKKLDATNDANRKIYTSVANVPVRMEFSTANAGNALLQNLLTTADAATTTTLINWVRSARFGLGNAAVALTRLGSIETSTPAILNKPGRPSWYAYVSASERARIDAFVATQANRKPLVMVGTKDGMLHAFHTRPTSILDTKNGTEAWAYIPPTVASGMLKDFTATKAANAAATDGVNHPKVSSYPDGSPTLVDYHAGNGTYKTVALIAEGNGGRSISALEVTETVNRTTDAVTGPQPMWSATPGDGDAGQAYIKPAVARVQIGGVERYLAIAGTGIDYTDTLGQKGRVVSGYDLVNGTLLWKFQAKCPVTSDITVFETDDTGEAGAPALDGYADRIVFADNCGYVYKLAPGVNLSGGWLANTGMGSILANTTPDGKAQYALFSTKLSSGALGQDRPISGTIAARTDGTTRMVLFFGTGGLENVSANVTNGFYALYADTGAIRSKLIGTCNAKGCEKFYGGTIVTPEQVILTRTTDPVIGSGTCDLGSSTVQALVLDGNGTQNFLSSFTLAVSSAVMGALYGDAGAIFFATLSGDVARIGTPRAGSAGADTAANYQQGTGSGDVPATGTQVGTNSAFTMMGWRVVL